MRGQGEETGDTQECKEESTGERERERGERRGKRGERCVRMKEMETARDKGWPGSP